MTQATQARWDDAIPLPSPRANRPVTLLHRVEALAARGLLSWSRRTGLEKASDRFGRFARRFGPLLRPVHRRGLENLELVMPTLSRGERERILRDEWENLGRTAAEYAHLAAIGDRTRVVGAERLANLVSSGGQAVFVSGHFANWEAMAIALHRSGLRCATIYRAANNPLVDEEIIGLRAEVMSRRLIPKGKRGGRELLAAAKEGLSLCLLTDQKLNDGIEAPLLGRAAPTAPAPARLALRHALPVIPLEIVREPGSRFVLTVHDPIDFERTGDTAADTLALTTRINDSLSGFIRTTPGQWLWFHRRWPKARP
ncbi:lysophospholipid acyltransferase family protein [Parvularcula dongshanensis]|uniref:KDO2-lipid IV(A) lauroyltransferase n=1 Tax=Parvularcula dongshanensis TaxID=1173995 RepID=A0A840I761_9PROT|nr:lauroyl acyltransferase [Parvularcula dongshanensis]MBB4660101.1 KDO2-lipid IV(A) lauroyltransferase [Parvularcula dongshanensis]